MVAPVYLKVADVGPRTVRAGYPEGTPPEKLLHQTWGSERANRDGVETLLQSSFDSEQLTALHSERNDFIGTVLTAYGQHHHLIIRPDDVRLAILTQFNYYVNCNAEQLRSQFVAHEDKKTLRVDAIDFVSLAKKMTEEIHNSVLLGSSPSAHPQTVREGIRRQSGSLILEENGISGWIIAFSVWSEKRKWCGPALPEKSLMKVDYAWFASAAEWPKFAIELETMPVGFFDFDLTLVDDVIVHDCIIVAGNLASLTEGAAHDTICPQSGWFVFTKVANQQAAEMQAKLRTQEESGKEKRRLEAASTKAKKYDFSHSSGCFCRNSSMFTSILAPVRR